MFSPPKSGSCHLVQGAQNRLEGNVDPSDCFHFYVEFLYFFSWPFPKAPGLGISFNFILNSTVFLSPFCFLRTQTNGRIKRISLPET